MPPTSAGDLRIQLASATQPVRGRGTTGDPLLLQAGTAASFIALHEEARVRPTWAMEANVLGQISADGVLIARHTGNGAVTATLDSMSAQFAIRVLPGDLAMLRVEPQIFSTLSTAEPQTFSVDGFDLYGNPLSASDYATLRWSVTGGIGTVTLDGVFTPAVATADAAITGTVVVASQEIYGSASVTVVSEIGALAMLDLFPQSTRIVANDSIEIRVIGRDDNGNLLPSLDTPIVLRLTPDVGTVVGAGESWRYRAPMRLPSESNRIVNLQAETPAIVSPLVPIALFPASLATLQLEPDAATVRAGATQQFRLTGMDAFGNPIDPTDLPEPPAWSLSDPLGDLTDTTPEEGIYTAKQVGTTHLTVRAGNVTASAEIQIVPGEMAALSITPETVSITAGEVVEFRLSGVDAHGNRVDELQATWQVIGFGDSERLDPSPSNLNRRLWKPMRVGNGHIEARWTDAVTGKTLRTQAAVQVTAGKLASLEIQVMDDGSLLQRPYVLHSGGIYSLNATGRDAFENAVDVDVTWHLVGNLGRIVSNEERGTELQKQVRQRQVLPLLEAIFVGEGSLLANAGGIDATEKITIRPIVATIGESGGRVDSPAGIVLSIPPRAFATNRNVEIAIIESPGAALTAQRVTRVIEIRPRGEILKPPAQLTFSYARPVVNEFDPTQLSLYFWDDFQEKWIAISSHVDSATKTVTASVNHFASYTLMSSDQVIPRSEELRIDGLQLNPPVFYAPETNRLTIEYLLNAPDSDEADVTIELFDFRDQHIVTLLDRAPRRIGRNAEQWEGRTESGETVRNGRYVLVIIAEAGGQKVAAKKLLIVFK
ncbi:MAG: hypothetical protein O7E52_03495 [Candidatus Poribacteria bacterium]|nr:hypothetical protein [Candidatus Poribacteria bacterium]